jgi:hypothetical protein
MKRAYRLFTQLFLQCKQVVGTMWNTCFCGLLTAIQRTGGGGGGGGGAAAAAAAATVIMMTLIMIKIKVNLSLPTP